MSDPGQKPRLIRRDFLECGHASTGSHFLSFGFTNSWQGQHSFRPFSSIHRTGVSFFVLDGPIGGSKYRFAPLGPP